MTPARYYTAGWTVIGCVIDGAVMVVVSMVLR